MTKSNNTTDSADYVVGYKHPPSASQFKPGQSGNRQGRPKGSQNFSTVIDKELNSLVTVTENGQRKSVRKKSVIAKQLVNKAATGDIKATTLLLNEARGYETAMSRGVSTPAPTLAHEDELVMTSMLVRIRRTLDSQPLDALPTTSTHRQRVQLNPEGDAT